MSHRTHAPLLLLVAGFAVLAAIVGAAPVGAATAIDESPAADSATSAVVGQTEGGNVTFGRDGAYVVVSVPVSAFDGNPEGTPVNLSLVSYDRTIPLTSPTNGSGRYEFRIELRELVGDAPVTDRQVDVRLTWGKKSETGILDVRYLRFRDGNVRVEDRSFGFPVRVIGLENGSRLPMTVGPQGRSAPVGFNATLRLGPDSDRVWVDPSAFLGEVSPLGRLRFTAFPNTQRLTAVNENVDLRNHAGPGTATFTVDGDRVRVEHPLLFDGTDYVVVAGTTDPEGRYVGETTAGQSGGLGTVSVPGSVTAAGSVNVTVLADRTPVFRGGSPMSESREVNATWANASQPATFRFDGGLPDRVRTVWLAHDERVWSVTKGVASEGTNLKVRGDALNGTGRYELLVVGDDGSVLRGEANVTQPEGTESQGTRSQTGDLSGTEDLPYLSGLGALLLGAVLTLLGVNAGRALVGSMAGAAVTTVLGVTAWLFAMFLLVTFSVSDPYWMLGSVVVGIGVAGLTAGSMDGPSDAPSDITGPVFVFVVVLLTGIGGYVAGYEAWMDLGIVAGLGLFGSLGAFLAMELLSVQPSQPRTNDVTVQLVDRRTGRQANTDLDVTVRSSSSRPGRPSDQRRITVTGGQGVVSLPKGTWEFDPGKRGKTVQEPIQRSTRVQIPVKPTGLAFRARSPEGDPVVGATVSFTVNGQERQLSTGDNGVTKSELPAGVTEIEVTIDHDRYEPVTRTLNTATGGRIGAKPNLDETLEPLTGGLETVVTLDGEDVPDVAVVAEPGPDVVGGTERTTTDRAGRAAFDDLPIGEYTVGVDLEGAAEEFVAPDSTVTVTEGETRTEGLPVRFDYRLGGGSTRRIEAVRSRLDATTSHPRSDMSIPAFYASVVEELLRTVERVPEEGTTFLAAGRSPEETVDALLAAAEAGVDAVDEAMSDKQNVDLFAACADMEPAGATWDGSFSLADLFELAELQPGKRRGRVAERLDTVNDRISDELRGLSEVGPARSAWEQTRDLASDRSREGLEAAATTMLAEGLLEAIEALFERESLRERMTRTVF